MAKARYKTSEIIAPGFDLPDDYSELVKVYRTVAKAADERLVRLERTTQEDNFHIAKQWAYARAKRDIEAWGGPEAQRFNIKPPKSASQLKAKIEDIKTFLVAPTSTKTGVKNVYKARAKTLKKNYGLDLKWDQLGKFFESSTYKKLEEKMDGSPTVVRIIAHMQRNKKEILKAIEEADTKDLRVPDNMTGELIKQTVKDYGQEIYDLLLKK